MSSRSDKLSPSLVNFRDELHDRSKNVRNATDRILLERWVSMKYFTHFERFIRLPQLAATIDAVYTTEAARACSLVMMIEGTNADDAGVEWLPGGGIRMETAGADNDQHILLAHTDGDHSGLANVDWKSANRLLFAATIKTGPEAADIAETVLWAGWKLTNTAVVVDDDHQAFFRYSNSTHSGNWAVITSVGGVDTETDTGIKVVANTLYRLLVVLDKDRIPYYYINDLRVGIASSVAMAVTGALEFYIGVENEGAVSAAARELDVRNFVVSQLYG